MKYSLTEEQYQQRIREHAALPETDPDAILANRAATIGGAPPSKSIYEFVGTKGASRDQGTCGNCWVWASVGCLEIETNIRNFMASSNTSPENIKLSIEYFDALYYRQTTSNACGGGSSTTAANSINLCWNANSSSLSYVQNTAANANSNYLDADLPESKSGKPNARLDAIGTQDVSTWSSTIAVSATTSKAHMKKCLDAKIPMVFTMFLGNNANGWDAFNNFWYNEPVDTIWMPSNQTPGPPETPWGGHDEILIGYYEDPSDESKSYWEILNSWGTHYGRPNGTWRLSMNESILFQESNHCEVVSL